MDKKRILIVDDDLTLLHLLRTAIYRICPQYDVTLATDGKIALDYLHQHQSTHPFNIVVTDYEMPVMNGAELAKAVRHTWPNIRIVLMSGVDVNYLQTQINAVRFDDYLQKPFDPQAFKQAVCPEPDDPDVKVSSLSSKQMPVAPEAKERHPQAIPLAAGLNETSRFSGTSQVC